ncbi:GNAT family N-acetyltransferase [Porticoccus sp. GXU_MW_L64]
MKQPLETDRLIIRPMVESDFGDYLAYAQDAQVMAFIHEVGTVDEIRQHFNGYMAPWKGEENIWMGAAVTLKGNSTLIGDIGFRYRDKESEIIEIGYKFSRHHHGRGYGHEAMATFIELIKRDWPVHKLVAYADPDNTPSVRLMEKLGLEKEGHFTSHYKLGGRWTDEVAYGLVV